MIEQKRLGERVRQLRKQQGLTLRALAEAVGVNHTYLSKIENDRAGYTPGADTIRALADGLGEDPLEFLALADKVPPELQGIASDGNARRFLRRAREVAVFEDWEYLLNVLERLHRKRKKKG